MTLPRANTAIHSKFRAQWANGFVGPMAVKANMMEIPGMFWVVHFCLPETP